jgi:hypothetical protein
LLGFRVARLYERRQSNSIEEQGEGTISKHAVFKHPGMSTLKMHSTRSLKHTQAHSAHSTNSTPLWIEYYTVTVGLSTASQVRVAKEIGRVRVRFSVRVGARIGA